MNSDYIPVLAQILVAVGMAGAILILSVIFGKKGPQGLDKNRAYECGMIALGTGTPRFNIKFYLVAMLFVLFDIEVVFLYPWALIFKDVVLKNPVAFWSMTGFVGVLFVAYLYALKKGALNWA